MLLSWGIKINVNRNQEMEEAVLRRVGFPSFSSPKILHSAVVCVPPVHGWAGADSQWRVSAGEVVPSFQGAIPGPECC